MLKELTDLIDQINRCPESYPNHHYLVSILLTGIYVARVESEAAAERHLAIVLGATDWREGVQQRR